MNTSTNIILFALSLTYLMVIKGDNINNNKAVIPKQAIFERLIEFRDAEMKLFTDGLEGSLDEILTYFNKDNREFCHITGCMTGDAIKTNLAKTYVTDNPMYSEANIIFTPSILSSLPGLGHVVNADVAYDVTRILTEDNITKQCEYLSIGRYQFYLNEKLEITKWISMPPVDYKEYEYSTCVSLVNQNNDKDIADEQTRYEIIKQLDTKIAILKQKLSSVGMDFMALLMSDVKSIKQVESKDEDKKGKVVEIIFTNHIVIKYFVSSDGNVDENSIEVLMANKDE